MSDVVKTDVRFGDFVIRTWLINESVAGFELLHPYSFERAEFAPGGVHGATLVRNVQVTTFKKRGAAFGSDTTESIDEADVEAHGSVRFDGCANFVVADTDDSGNITCMAHTCGPAGFDGMMEALKAAYLIAYLMVES